MGLTTLTTLATLVMWTALVSRAPAQTFPQKPIRIILPYLGGTDFAGRWIAYIGLHGGTRMNPMTNQLENNGTAIDPSIADIVAAAMRDWARRNPGRLTHPNVRNFLGATFLKQALYELVPDAGVLTQALEEAIDDLTTELGGPPSEDQIASRLGLGTGDLLR